VGDVFERVSIYITGPNACSCRGHIYVLTVVDSFSKGAKAVALRDKGAVTVANLVKNDKEMRP